MKDLVVSLSSVTYVNLAPLNKMLISSCFCMNQKLLLLMNQNILHKVKRVSSKLQQQMLTKHNFKLPKMMEDLMLQSLMLSSLRIGLVNKDVFLFYSVNHIANLIPHRAKAKNN